MNIFLTAAIMMHDIDKTLLKMMCLRNLLIVLHTSLGWEPPAVCLPFFFFFSPHVTPNIVLLDVNSANTMNQKTLKMWETNKLVFPMGQKHLGHTRDRQRWSTVWNSQFICYFSYTFQFSCLWHSLFKLQLLHHTTTYNPNSWALLSLLAHNGLCTQTTEVVVDVFFPKQCLAE